MIEEALIQELLPRAQRAAQGWQPEARITSITPLTGGASSLTFTALLDGADGIDRVVLKVAPPG